MTKRRVVIYLEEEQDDVLEEIQTRSLVEDPVPKIDSKSAMLRDAVDDLIADYRAEYDIEAVVDDETLLEYRHQQRKDETKPISRGSKFAERFSDHCDRLFTGDKGQKADIQTIRQIADVYIEDVRDHHELGGLSEESMLTQIEAIEERVEQYRDDLEAAQYAPDDRDVPDEVEIGRDIRTLREEISDVVATIVDRSEGDAYDPDAIVDAISEEYGVGEPAIEYVLDVIVPDGESTRGALKDGRDVDFLEILPDDAIEARDDVEALESSEQRPNHPDDDGPLQIVGSTAEDGDKEETTNGHENGHSDEDVIEVDAELLQEQIDDEIEATNGADPT
jgi:transcription elongation GreA/GreB family factor